MANKKSTKRGPAKAQRLSRSTGKSPAASRLATLTAVLLVLLTASVSYAIVVTMSNNRNWHDLNAEKTLRVAQAKVPGFACGVLSPNEVQQLMGITLQQKPSVTRSAIVIDECSYTNASNSNGYAEVIIRTYPTSKDAARQFVKEQPLKITAEDRDAVGYGDKLTYTSGSFALLKDNQIIEVSASKPGLIDADQETFARQALNYVVEDL